MASSNNTVLQKKLDSILNKIKLTKQDEYNRILREVFAEVLERMKSADGLFKKMYKYPVYTGSYYEKLRIKDACEFDINLVLEVPARSSLKVVATQNPPSYAVLHLEKAVVDLGFDASEVARFNALKLLDKEGNFEPRKVLEWFQSIFSKAKLSQISVNGVKQINVIASGPALTLLVILNDGTEISVDLVPVFVFPFTEWPKEIKNLRQAIVSKTPTSKQLLYLVPKQYKAGVKQSPLEPAAKDKQRIWRMHFADVEKEFLQTKPDAKPVIKLLKLLRDSQGWSGLHSYFLKTLVLSDIAKNPKKEWKHSLLADRFLEMLEVLKTCLEQNSLPHFFFSSVNLLQFLNDVNLRNMSQRLERIIKKIQSDPGNVDEFLKA